MRTTRTLLVAVAAASAVLLTGAAPAAACGAAVRIAPRTSTIFDYDGSPDGTGPIQPATTVSAVARRCPAGTYQLDARLVQDGVAMQWATHAKGAGEVFCDGDGPTVVRMDFTGPSLHPGRARATFRLVPSDCDPAGCRVLSGVRTVRIPRAHHR